jgi:hypothetical protein
MNSFVEKGVNNLVNKLQKNMWIKIVDNFEKISFPYKSTKKLGVLPSKSTMFYTIFLKYSSLFWRVFYTIST